MLSTPQVRVALRFRPLNAEEKTHERNCNDKRGGGGPFIYHTDSFVEVADFSSSSFPSQERHNTPLPLGAKNNNAATALVRAPTRRFQFDTVLSETATQRDVYTRVGAPVVAAVLRGSNATVLACGPAGSGKTHTMLGPHWGGEEEGGNVFFSSPVRMQEESRGLIPRIMEELFEELNARDAAGRTWRMTASMCEIHGDDDVVDLLREGPQEDNYKVEHTSAHESNNDAPLHEVPCRSVGRVLRVVHAGALRRRTPACVQTHCALCLNLQRRDPTTGRVLAACRLNLVDLAGSDKVCGEPTGAGGLRETQCMNISLTLLANFIRRLTDEKFSSSSSCDVGDVPHYDSKLRKLLRDSLAGSSLTTLICHASPAAARHKETLETLWFAQRVGGRRVRGQSCIQHQFTAKEMMRAHNNNTCALDQMRLPEGRRLQNENGKNESENNITEMQQVAWEKMLENETIEKMSSLVNSFMNEVEVLKKDIEAKEDELREQRECVEFYKQQCSFLKEELVDVSAQHKEKEEKILHALRTVEYERDMMAKQLEKQKITNDDPAADKRGQWKPLLMAGIPDTLTLTDVGVAQSNNNNDHNNNNNDNNGECASTLTHYMGSVVTLVLDGTVKSPQAKSEKTIQENEQREDIKESSEKSIMTQPMGETFQAQLRKEKTSSSSSFYTILSSFDYSPEKKKNSPSPPAQSVQLNNHNVALLEMPAMIDIQVNHALDDIVCALRSVGRQDHKQILLQYEKSWMHTPKKKTEENNIVVPRDIMFNALDAAHTVLSKEDNICGETIENVRCDEQLLPLVLTVLKNIVQQEEGEEENNNNNDNNGDNKPVLEVLRTEEVLHALEVLRSSSTTGLITIMTAGDVDSHKPGVLVFDDGATLEDSVVVVQHTSSELAEARSAVRKAVESAMAVMYTEMLPALQGRVTTEFTSEEISLGCRLLETRICAARGASPNVCSETLHRVVGDLIELIEALLHAAGVSHLPTEFTRAVDTAEKDDENNNNENDVFVSGRVGHALRTLRSYAAVGGQDDAQLLDVYYSEEVRQAMRALDRAFTCAAATDEEESEGEASFQPRNDLQSAVHVVQKYALAFRDMCTEAARPPPCLLTASVLHALHVVARLLRGVVGMCTGPHVHGAPPMSAEAVVIVREAFAATEHVIHRVVSSRRLLIIVTEEEEQKEKEKNKNDTALMAPTMIKEAAAEEEDGKHAAPPVMEEAPQDHTPLSTVGEMTELARKIRETSPAPLTGEEHQTINGINRIIFLANGGGNSSAGNMKRVVDDCRLSEPRDASPGAGGVPLSRTPSTRPRSIEPAATGAADETANTMKIDFTNNNHNKNIVVNTTIRKDVAVMTENLLGLSPLFPLLKLEQLPEKSVQTNDTAQDMAAYMQLFMNLRSTFGGKEKEKNNAAVELFEKISTMQKQLTHMLHVREPGLVRELRDVHNAVRRLQQFMRENPCLSSSTSKQRSMPSFLRRAVRCAVIPSPRHKDPLSHSSSSTHMDDAAVEGWSQSRALAMAGTMPGKDVAAETTQQVVEEVLRWCQAWMKLRRRERSQTRETAAHLTSLEKQLSTTRRERDACRADVDALREALAKMREENTTMREALDSLHFDLEACTERFMRESSMNATLRAEANTLKGAATDLRRTADQIEFCDMAEVELQMKLEDFRAIETEMLRLRTLYDESLVERKRKLLKRAVGELAKFAEGLLAVLQVPRRFNTGTLESRRLTLLDGVTALADQINEGREILQA